jgi:acetate---CoA ligase (ADP-forming)
MNYSLDALFKPNSIAIIGASNDPTRVSGRPVQMLKDAGYGGRIYPVNPRRDSVQGLRSFSSLGAVGERVDLVLIAVPASGVEDALRDCCAARVGAAIVFGSGYAETGAHGRTAQERLAAIARTGGVRLLGPNCMGMFNTRERAYVTFPTVFSADWPEPGNVGLVSQSGAFAAFCYSRAKLEGLNLSYGAMTGNEADIDFADCLEWLIKDETTKIIIGFMEGFADGPKLCRALSAARAERKPVIILKVGRSPLGIATASSHTAQLSGEDAVFDAVFAEYGVHRAKTVDELFDVARLAASGGLPVRLRLGILTISGGAGVLMSDVAYDCGVTVPQLPEPVQRELRVRVPFASLHNPIDTTGQVLDDKTLLPAMLDALCSHADVDAVTGFYAGMGLSDAAPQLVDQLTAAAKRHPNVRQIVCALCTPAVRDALWAAGIPVFGEPSRAIAAFAAVTRIGQAFTRPAEMKPAPIALHLPVAPAALDEEHATALLSPLGICTPTARRAATPKEAGDVSEALGFPVVVKVLSPALAHKTETGAVTLNLQSRGEVVEASLSMLPPRNDRLKGVPVTGLYVVEMKMGVELIIGIHRDPVFGPVIMAGMGGIYAELLQDTAIALAPVTPAAALGMLRSLSGFHILEGARGRPRCDADAAADAISRLSRASLPAECHGIEINPLIVGAEGSGAWAADCLVT